MDKVNRAESGRIVAARCSPSRDEKLQACHEETGSLLASRSKKAKCCFPYWLADDLASPARADSGARAPLSIHKPLCAETPSRRPWKLMAERIDTLASGVSCQLCPSSLLSNTPWVCSAVASRRWPAASYCTASTSFLGSPPVM